MQFCSCNEEGPNEIPGECSNVVLAARRQDSALCTLVEYTVAVFEATGRKVSQSRQAIHCRSLERFR